MASRVFRFALRLAKEGIDHRTIRDTLELILEGDEGERTEPQPRPRPRPLPYVDHGEATRAAIPRAPLLSAQELGAALAHIRRWMLLSPLATVGDCTEFGGRADFHIVHQAPPRLSTLHLYASAVDATAAYDLVSFDGDGGVLLLRVRYTDLARVPALAYLLCDTATRRATPVPTSLARRPRCPGRVGVIRGSNRVVLAEVEEGSGESRLRVIIFPDMAEPFVHGNGTPFPPGAPRPWGSHGVVNHGGCIYFIDRTTGMLRFDPADAATLQLITFPAAPAGQHHARYVGVTGGAMMLAVVDQQGRLRTWAFSEQWQQRHLAMTLPESHCFGFLHPIHAQTVYLLNSSGAGQSSIVRADLETGACTVEGRIPSASAARLITMEMH